MSTKLELKEAVAVTLGKTNAAVPVPKRDVNITKALRQYVGDWKWSWNWATASLSDGSAIPLDFSSRWDPVAFYYEGTWRRDVFLVRNADLAAQTLPSFSVDSGTFETNVTSAVTMAYQMKAPAIASDGSDDSEVLPMPDISTVERLSDAFYWLSAERDEDNFDRFMKEEYRGAMLRRDIAQDRSNATYPKPRPATRDLGWNRVRGYY